MLEGNIPSLAASVVYKDDIIWSKGYGEQSNDNVTFMIASITKTFPATALLQLYERGLFELDDDVNNYLLFSFFLHWVLRKSILHKKVLKQYRMQL